jgi:hypothetical protein
MEGLISEYSQAAWPSAFPSGTGVVGVAGTLPAAGVEHVVAGADQPPLQALHMEQER